jgi:hypothetical protein
MRPYNDVTLEQLLIECLDGEDHEAPENSPKTPECPSYREFEAHARGSHFLGPDAMRHVNRCPDYCQLVLSQFRQQCGQIQPRFSHAGVQKLAAHGNPGAARTYDALVESRQGEVLGSATIVITDGPFLTEDNNVVFRMSVTEPRFQPEMLPIQVLMSDAAELPSRIFRFDLPTQASEVIKMKIPEDLLGHERWQHIDTTAHLPLSFVVCPLGRSELIS